MNLRFLVTASKVHEFYISFIHLLSPKWNVESMFTYMYVYLYTDIICIYVIFTIIHVNTLVVIKMQCTYPYNFENEKSKTYKIGAGMYLVWYHLMCILNLLKSENSVCVWEWQEIFIFPN